MDIFRICGQTYKDDISGKGAEIFGGRWNNKGTAMLYTAPEIGTCLAEHLVHVSNPKTYPNNQWLTTIEIPDDLGMVEIPVEDLPDNWKDYPGPYILKEIGDEFCRSKMAPLLIVPSIPLPGTKNFLINPKHPDFKRIKVTKTAPYPLDDRMVQLIKKGGF